MSRRKTTSLGAQQFYKFEKWILAEKKIKNLSPVAKLLYMVIRDREEISLKNAKDFTDKDGCLFQYFDQVKASELLGVSLSPIKKAFKDLQEYKLIESVRQGQGKPNRIYVLEYEISNDTLEELSYEKEKAPTCEVEDVNKNSTCTNSICNNNTNNTSNEEKNKDVKTVNEVIEILENNEIKNVNKKEACKIFTDIDKLIESIDKCGTIKQYKYLIEVYNTPFGNTAEYKSNKKGFNSYEGSWVNDVDLDEKIEISQKNKYSQPIIEHNCFK